VSFYIAELVELAEKHADERYSAGKPIPEEEK
jgi:hypothetical protein